MQKFIDVWVCRNKNEHAQLCVYDREDIEPEGIAWTGVGKYTSTQCIGRMCLRYGHPSFEMFYNLTEYPNKVKATLIFDNGENDPKKKYKLI